MYLLFDKANKVCSAFSIHSEMGEKLLIPTPSAVIGHGEQVILKAIPTSSSDNTAALILTEDQLIY